MGWFKLFYFLVYISFTTHHFLNIYFRNIGLSGIEIGSIKALSSIVMIFSQPLWGFLCDMLQMRKGLLNILLFFAATTFLLVPLKDNFFWIFIMIGIYGIFKSPIVPVADSMVMLEVNGDGKQYSQIRLWGGIGLTVSVVLMGYYFNLNRLKGLFEIYAFFTMGAFFIAFFLPQKKSGIRSKRLKINDFYRLFKYCRFFIFLLAILFLQTGAFIIDGFFGLFVKERIGNEITLGWALTIAGISEVFIYYILGKCDSINYPGRLLIISSLVSAARWYLYAKSQLVIQIFLLQGLHGLTFGFFYISAVTYVDGLLPKEFATSGQTLLWAIAFGIAAVLGSVLGGYFYDHWNFDILFKFAALLALISSLILVKLKKD